MNTITPNANATIASLAVSPTQRHMALQMADRVSGDLATITDPTSKTRYIVELSDSLRVFYNRFKPNDILLTLCQTALTVDELTESVTPEGVSTKVSGVAKTGPNRERFSIDPIKMTQPLFDLSVAVELEIAKVARPAPLQAWNLAMVHFVHAKKGECYRSNCCYDPGRFLHSLRSTILLLDTEQRFKNFYEYSDATTVRDYLGAFLAHNNGSLYPSIHSNVITGLEAYITMHVSGLVMNEHLFPHQPTTELLTGACDMLAYGAYLFSPLIYQMLAAALESAGFSKESIAPFRKKIAEEQEISERLGYWD